MGDRLVKFSSGTSADPSRERAHEYAPVVLRQAMGERGELGERLIMTTPGSPMDLVRDLSACLAEPLGLMYKLWVARARGEAGWYYSPLIGRAETAAFLGRFAEFLSCDARHELWVCHADSNANIVYDTHDWVYGYGPLDAMAGVAARHGLRPGRPEMPVPHAHHYHAEFDGEQDQLLAWWEWTWYPLDERDRE